MTHDAATLQLMEDIREWLRTLNDDDRDAILRHSDPTDNGCDLNTCLVGTVNLHRTNGRSCHIPYSVIPDSYERYLWDAVCRAFPCLATVIGPENAWAFVKSEIGKMGGPGHCPFPSRSLT